MTESKRAWDMVSKERRKDAIKKIVDYFTAERDEELGVIAAEEILDFFLQTIGGDIYNKALDDMRPILEQEYENMLLNADISLRKQIDTL